jgi:CYTH domain-containing protein
MATSRRYLIASSLARLIRRERGGNRVTEGHFPNQADRSSFVVVEGEKGSLVLLHSGPNGPVEERTEVPRTHAEALLDVTPGKLDYLVTHLTVGTRDVHVIRYVTPGPMDLISVSFESEEEARDFRPLSWFGADVTADAVYQNRSIALDGIPQVPDVQVSNGALNSLLDTLENRYGGAPRQPASQPQAQPQAQAQPHPQLRRPAEPAPEHAAPAQSPAPTGERAAAPQANGDVRSEAVSPVDVEVVDEDANDLNIEDNVIRELARSLRPQRR